ncbi:hypothetical protein PG988_007876 [Apiospora saccharicola]
MVVVAPTSFTLTDRVSAPFAWAAAGVKWTDEALGAVFRCPQRGSSQEEIPGWHEPCFRFGSDRLGMRDGWAIHEASHFGHPPEASHNRRRFVRLQGELAPMVHAQHPALPLEICLDIAGYLVPEYAVCLLDSQWRMHSSRLWAPRVNLERDIWACFVTFEGTRYLADVSNAPAPGLSTKIHHGRPNDGSTEPPMAFMLEDHLGVRALLSTASTPSNQRRLDLSPVEGQVVIRFSTPGQDMGFLFDVSTIPH